LERSHITFTGPGRIVAADGKTLLEIRECRFEDTITTPAPGPAGDARYPMISAMEPIELHLDFNDRHRRLLAAIVLGWRAKGPVRWINTMRAMKMTRIRKKKKRSELF